MAQVIFDPVEFKLLYPEFTNIPDIRLYYFFSQSEIYLSNKDNSIVQDIDFRKILLYMLTAHIGVLSGAFSTDNKTVPVGRINEAQEGSVEASFDYNAPDAASWFIQTQYGAAFWQATRSIRTMNYFSPPGCSYANIFYN